MERMEIANNVASAMEGRIWAPKGDEGIIRVYVGKGFCQIESDGVNIDNIKRQNFDDIKDICRELGINTYR